VVAVRETLEAEALAQVGAMVRKLRRERALTVEALAAAAGLSAGLISQVERGIGNPSFTTLLKLASTLSVPLGTFLSDPASQPGRNVVRKHERKRLEPPGEGGLVYELLTPDLQRDLQMLHTRMPPGFDGAGQPFRHAGEECQHVLAGQLEIFVGNERYELSEGDSITYDSNLPHWYRNPGAEWAEFIGAVTPPSF
jgi:transcriptional regulator with XRE-family HTH domain